ASLAQAMKKSNQEFLRTGLDYARLARVRSDPPVDAVPDDGWATTEAQLHEAELRWRVARKNMHIAFGNFASAFYRMMDEPAKRQKNVPELNNLLIQNHVLASQITSAVPILASLDAVPDGIQMSLQAIQQSLDGQEADAPVSIETEGQLAALAYPIRQMVKAAQLIRQEMRGLTTTALPAA